MTFTRYRYRRGWNCHILRQNFVDGKGGLIMMSGDYPEKAAAEKTIQDVRVGSPMSNQITASKIPRRRRFFVIKDAGGQILVKSVLPNSTMLFDNARHAVKDNACIAEINDMTTEWPPGIMA